MRHMRDYRVAVAMFAETLRDSVEDLIAQAQRRHFLFLHHSGTLPDGTRNRGRFGLGFLLDVAAERAYHRAGGWRKTYGARLFAVRLHYTDCKGKIVKFFLGTGHAPTSRKPSAQLRDFHSRWQEMLADVEADEILVNPMDANAQLGVASSATSRRSKRWDGAGGRRPQQVLGPWGLDKTTEQGREMLEVCASHELCAPMSFFRHKQYATWTHPRWKTQHQIDHWFLRRRDLKRVIDARVFPKVALHSDHRPIMLVFRLARNLAHRHAVAKPTACTQLLRQPQVLHAFRSQAVVDFERALEVAGDNLGQITNPIFEAAKGALSTAAQHALPVHSERRQPGWFTLGEAQLMPCIRRRQEAETRWNAATGDAKVAAAATYAKTRRDLQACVRRCQREWIMAQVDGIRPGAPPGFYWQRINLLRGGLGSTCR